MSDAQDPAIPEVSRPDAKTASEAKRGCDGLFTTGDMARLSSSTLRTVRFYEQAGLIKPQRRSCGGHRLFAKRELTKLQLALDLREAGLSVDSIKSLFKLKAACSSPEEASDRMSAVLNEQIECMQQKITKLRRLREELAAMIAVISECHTCDNKPSFPLACGDCDVLENPDLPRALRVLWKD